MSEPSFDVFLSYDSRDRAAVQRVAATLERHGCSCFLDQWYLKPGRDWVAALQQALDASRSVAVFLGPRTELSGWQQREVSWALDRQANNENFTVVPVLLPDCTPPLGFLKQLMWIDLRGGDDDPAQVAALAAAARGEPVDRTGWREPRLSICPYRGLLVFREEDAAFFFGRDKYIDALLAKVEQRPLVAVVGASGSGKSSVVRAGLASRLRARSQSPVWDIATMVPGEQPLHALADVLLRLLEPELAGYDRVRKIGLVAQDLQESATALPDLVAEALRVQKGTDRLLLVIDQWEELYTQCEDGPQRRAFIDQLLDAASRKRSPLSVVLTVRSDFYGELLDDRPLRDQLQDGEVKLGPMTRDELREAIKRPSAEVRLRFESGLVDRLLGDARDEPGRLPLLEFALEELWQHRRGDLLTHEAYEQMDCLSGAIAARAEAVFGTLSSEQQAAAPRLFRRLVRAGAKTAEDTRRRADFQSLDETSQATVLRLTDERLLVMTQTSVEEFSGGCFDAGVNLMPPAAPPRPRLSGVVEVAHEELLRRWARLEKWVNEDRQFLQWRARLGPLLEQHDRDPTALLRGRVLREARQFYTSRGIDNLLVASARGTEYAVQQLGPYRWLAIPRLHRVLQRQEFDSQKKLRAAIALARWQALEDVELQFLLDAIADAEPAECENFSWALQEMAGSLEQPLLERAQAAESDRAKCRYAATGLSLGLAGPARFVTTLPVDDSRDPPYRSADPSARTEFIHAWTAWPPEVDHLPRLLREHERDNDFCSAVCCALGLLDPSGFSDQHRESLVAVMRELYQSAPGGGTHSAAGWALRQWQATPLPALPTGDKIPADRDWFVNSLGMTLVRIPGGTFRMGSEDDDPAAFDDEKPAHDVTVAEFWMSDREVTSRQYSERFGALPIGALRVGGGGSTSAYDYPFESATWLSAQDFLEWLRKETGQSGYDLPREMQWEYACRSGTRTMYCFGDDDVDRPQKLDAYAVFDVIGPSPPGNKLPNRWGMFDMHGNVSELCGDPYQAYRDRATKPDALRASRESAGHNQLRLLHIQRGGAWSSSAVNCRSAGLSSFDEFDRYAKSGFRVCLARSLVAPQPEPAE